MTGKPIARMTPGRERWLEMLADGGPLRPPRELNRVAYECRYLGWTQPMLMPAEWPKLPKWGHVITHAGVHALAGRVSVPHEAG